MVGELSDFGFLQFYARMEKYLDRATQRAFKIAPVLEYFHNQESLRSIILQRLMEKIPEAKTTTQLDYHLFVYDQVKQVIIETYRHSKLLESAIETSPIELDGLLITQCHKNVSSDKNEPKTADEWIAFHESIHRLKPEEKKITELTYYGGLSSTEVSQMLAISPNSIMKILERSHTQLLLWHLLERASHHQSNGSTAKTRIEIDVTITLPPNDDPHACS